MPEVNENAFPSFPPPQNQRTATIRQVLRNYQLLMQCAANTEFAQAEREKIRWAFVELSELERNINVP